jgi:hypothetical protein
MAITGLLSAEHDGEHHLRQLFDQLLFDVPIEIDFFVVGQIEWKLLHAVPPAILGGTVPWSRFNSGPANSIKRASDSALNTGFVEIPISDADG